MIQVSRFLMETIKDAKLHDIFSAPADGAQCKYTWLRSDGSIRSRIDFLFVSHEFLVRSNDIKLVLAVGLSEELKRDYTGWRTAKSLFECPGDSWETVKGKIKRFFILKRVHKVREMRGILSQLQKRMQNLLLLQTKGVDVMEDLQEVKSLQASLFASEASKIIFRSRVGSVEQDETCLCFFFQKVYRESSVISSLKEEDGLVMSSQSDILRISKSLNAGLYDMKPTDSTAFQSFLSSSTEILDDITWAFFHFVWRSKLDKVQRDIIYKELDKGGRNISNSTLTRMATFGCGCIKLCIDPRYANTKCHYLLRFYLSPVLQKIGLASLLWNTPSSWTIPYHLSFVEEFVRKNTFDHKSIKQGSAHSILETLREKERVDLVEWFPVQIAKVLKELTPTACCRLAHSKVQDYVLRNEIKFEAAVVKVQWGKTT
eukprot:g45048.t1